VRGAFFGVILVLLLASAALGGAKDDYAQGVASFKSLLASEKRAGLRAEWEAVMKPFRRSLAAQPKGEYAPRCMYFLGRCHEEMARRSFVRADRAAALDAFDRMLATFPKHEWADDALYRKGVIWQEQAKDAGQAQAAFKAVVATYPKGDMAADAGRRLAALQGQTVPAASAPQTVAAAPSKPAAPAKSVPAQAQPVKPAGAGPTLTGIRHWSSQDYTRVVMDVTGDVKYERNLVERAGNGGKQLQITLQRTSIDKDVMPARTIQDGILSQIRVGTDESGGALVTFDLMNMNSYRVFTLPEPYRVVLDIHGGEGGKETPVQQAKAQAPAADDDADHVQAALTELQAKQQTPPRQPAAQQPAASKQKVAAAAPANAPEPKTQPAVAPKAEETEPAPGMEVSAKQKKYAGSLVEQLGLKVRTIMIDAGHGGKDPGAMAGGVQEKNVNLRMARLLGGMLKEQGFEVHYTRTGDRFLPLEERTAMANAKNADLFISLHCNAYKDQSVRGLEVYYLNLATDAQAVRVAARENGVSAKKISDMQFILSDLMLNSKINESRQMASLIEKEVMRAVRPTFALTSHGSKGAFFYVLTGARMPSILVELGYLTNPDEAAKLNSDAYLTLMARGLTSGVVAYKKKLEQFALSGPGKS
jgi:N-acetylmuramoyl-L-alanine amidase